jgi:hypothetical protein
MHYEVELHELLYEADGTGGLRVTGSMWKPVRVFNKDAIPVPLTFEALGAAQAYVGRNQPGGRPHRAGDRGWRAGGGGGGVLVRVGSARAWARGKMSKVRTLNRRRLRARVGASQKSGTRETQTMSAPRARGREQKRLRGRISKGVSISAWAMSRLNQDSDKVSSRLSSASVPSTGPAQRSPGSMRQ